MASERWAAIVVVCGVDEAAVGGDGDVGKQTDNSEDDNESSCRTCLKQTIRSVAVGGFR